MTTVNGAQTHPTSLGSPTTEGTPSALDAQAFMRLLVAQIRHQDPLQPMDTTAMMGQLTQLAQVERLVAIDDHLSGLSVATASVANAQAADLVGRTVEADTSQIMLMDGTAGSGSFELEAAATSTRVEIRDAQGNVVRTLDLGAEHAGTVGFTWDGHDDAGNRMPAGRYRISVTATDGDGHPVEAHTRVRGPVSAVSYENGFPELQIGESSVVLGDVRSIEETPPPPPSAPATTTTPTTTTP